MEAESLRSEIENMRKEEAERRALLEELKASLETQQWCQAEPSEISFTLNGEEKENENAIFSEFPINDRLERVTLREAEAMRKHISRTMRARPGISDSTNFLYK
jgi:hypothetical protein